MTIFIYEHLTSGALLDEAFSSELLHEGDAMLTALTEDLMALGHRICLMRDSRLPTLSENPLLTVLNIQSPSEYRDCWTQSLKKYQRFIVIAPETDDILQSLVRQLEVLKKTHLGCTSSAISLCANKLRTAKILRARDIKTPVTLLAADWLSKNQHSLDDVWIVKPIDGAGCENTFKLTTQALKKHLQTIPSRQYEKLIVQPYINGEALSLSLFIDEESHHLLSVNRQQLAEHEHQLRLEQCVPCQNGLLSSEIITGLVRQIHDTIPGLWGFVGVDLVKAGDDLWVIEINPRLTSSFAETGFRHNRNPAQFLHQSLEP